MQKNRVILHVFDRGGVIASVSELSIDYADIDNGDLSAKLTWDGSTVVTVERALSENGPWQTMAESSTGTWTDPATTISLTYWYRLNDGTETGTAQKFVAVRRLSTDGYAKFCDGVSAEEAARAFDGNIGSEISNGAAPNCPDSGTKLARVGVDFGSPTNYVAFARLYPRNNYYAMRLSFLRLYGSDVADQNGPQVSLGMLDAVPYWDENNPDDKSMFRWYKLDASGETAYRCYYVCKTGEEGNNDQSAFYGNVGEMQLYGWTEDDVVDGSPVAPIDAYLSLKQIDRNNLDDFYPVLSWKNINCPLTIQRKFADGAWTTIGTVEGLAGEFTDESAPYGKLLSYRLKAGSGANAIANYSNVQTFRRLRKLNTDAYLPAFFSRGDSNWTGNSVEDSARLAFDGSLDKRSFPDIGVGGNNCHLKIGIDFGLPTNYVGLVRFYSRADGNGLGNSNGAALYGSMKSAEEEKNETLSVQLSGKTSFSAIGWQNFDIENPVPYRLYYYYGAYSGNMGEVELYGWSMEDVGESLPELNVDFKVSAKFEGSGVQYADYTGVLSWDSTLDSDAQILYLQRSPSASGPWSNILAVSNDNSYEDADAQYGWLWYYRLVGTRNNETIYSPVVSWRRFRKLNAASYSSSYIQSGNLYDNNGTGNIFDDNVNSYLDMYSPWRAGVDFGSPTNAVGAVRAYPRQDWTKRIAGSKLYGSQNDFATINSADYQHTSADIVWGVVAASDQGLRWYECMTEFTEFCRSYYISDFYEFGNVAELQFYGWSLDDCPDATPAVTGVVNGDNLVLTATRNAAYDGTNVTFYVHSYGPNFKPYLDEATSAGTVAFENGTASLTVPLTYGAKTTFWAVAATGESASGSIDPIPDTVTYSWKSDATGEKQWEDAANWTYADDGKAHLGYPGYLDAGSANVSFNDAGSVEVSINALYTVREFWIDGSVQKTIAFKGIGAEKSGIICGNGTFVFNENKTLILDAMFFRASSITLNDNVDMTLSGGTDCTVAWWFEMSGANSALHVDSASVLNTGVADNYAYYGMSVYGPGSWVDLNGTITTPRFRIGSSGEGAAPPRGVTFSGTSPTLEVRHEITTQGEFANGAAASFEFIVPVGGYASAPLRARAEETDGLAYQMLGDYYYNDNNSSAPSATSVKFTVSPDSPAYAGDMPLADVPLVSWPVYNANGLGGGINTARAALDSRAKVAPCELAFTYDGETATGITATLSRSLGLSVLVR